MSIQRTTRMGPIVTRITPLLLTALLTACATALSGVRGFYQAATSSKPYQDVMAELEVAITERNFRITGHNKIGSVIREREGKAFPDYDTVQFCNLTLAREMLEMSPESVVFMPCNVAVRAEGKKVIVSTHLLPTETPDKRFNTFAAGMNEKLKQIVDFAVEE